MKKIYSKLWGVLALCYGGVVVAENSQPVLLDYKQAPYTAENTADTPVEAITMDDLLNAEKSDPVILAPEELPNAADSNNKQAISIRPEDLSSLSDEDSNYAKVTSLAPENFSAISGKIANLLNVDYIDWQGINNHLQRPSEVGSLYGQLNYQLLWTQNGKVTQLAEQVIRAIADAPRHALRAELYHSESLSSLKAGQKVFEPEKFDVILSDAFITYKSHLANGIVDPKGQFPFWNKRPTEVDYAAIYLNAKSSGDISHVFSVNDPDYQALQSVYLKELSNSGEHQFTPVPDAATLRPGESGKAVQILRQRLGFNDKSDVYDDKLKQAVKDYQKDHGLKADGVAGKKTLKRLNRSPKTHLKTLAINMERHRWGYVPNRTYLQVNIPAFKMAIRKGKKYLFESNVIVGKTKRPTPIFSDTLEMVVLAPYWNVPKTIFNEDKLPKLQKNPNVFASTMQVINKATGKVVKPTSVDWSAGGKGYRLRQKPGARNALGRMKFLFPNRHAIYLHDTPNRRLFKRSKRAYSSGCIRVERAEDLAVFLLKDKNYNRQRIKKESRGKEKWVQLGANKRYPVFLDYYTAWVDADGKVRYSGDIYGYDKQLKSLYQNALNHK